MSRGVVGDPRDIFLDTYSTQEDWDRMAKEWGVHKPYYQQYGVFLKLVLRGDFGWAETRRSYRTWKCGDDKEKHRQVVDCWRKIPKDCNVDAAVRCPGYAK